MVRILFLILLQFFLLSKAYYEVNFAHITDLHIFETPMKSAEAKNSLSYFYLVLEGINQLELDIKTKTKKSLDFVIISGDIGIEKLLSLKSRDFQTNDLHLDISIDGKEYRIVKDKDKWEQAKQALADCLHNSLVKKWLIVPGNNDLYMELPETIIFYEEFLNELRQMPQIKESNLTLVDFRPESKNKTFGKFSPGTYKIGDLLFVGFDNSFFKNNNTFKKFLDGKGNVLPSEEVTEYTHLSTLNELIKKSSAKYAYVFYHIPEVDDPWMVKFSSDSKAKGGDNVVSKRLREAHFLPPVLAKEVYPHSSWTVTDKIRKLWESIVTNKEFKTPIVKGLFAGHFHDNQKSVYKNFDWIRTKGYKKEILDKLYISPSISVKNQFEYGTKDRARGGS